MPYLSDPSLGQFYKNPQTVFSVYSITFRSSCFDATGDPPPSPWPDPLT